MCIQGFHAIPNLYLLDDNSSRLVFPNCDYQSDLQILITFPQTAKSTLRKATTPKNGKSRVLEGRGKSVEASRKTWVAWNHGLEVIWEVTWRRQAEMLEQRNLQKIPRPNTLEKKSPKCPLFLAVDENRSSKDDLRCLYKGLWSWKEKGERNQFSGPVLSPSKTLHH